MRNAPGTAGCGASVLPRDREGGDRSRELLAAAPVRDHPKEHPRDDQAERVLKLVGLSALCLEQLSQLRRAREDTAFAILRGAGVESDLAGLEVHVAPFEREDFAGNPPTRDVGKADHGSQRFGKMPKRRGELMRFEEARPDVLFFEKRNVRFVEELATLNRKREHSFQGRQFAVDFGVGCTSNRTTLLPYGHDRAVWPS